MDSSRAAARLRLALVEQRGEHEEIADLCGHSGTTVTESVYRHELRPVLRAGAIAMDRTFRVEGVPDA